ncbi:MAG: phosphotransferase family protein [Hyphomicrobiales bacterium]
MRLRTQDRYDRPQGSIPLPPADARAILQELDPGLELASLEILAGGFSSTNYLLATTAGDRLVVRLAGRPAGRWHAELDVMALASTIVPVPKVFARTEHPSLPGVHAAIVEFVHGELLDDIELGPSESAHAIGRAVGATLAAIHSVTFASAGFFGPGPTVEPFDAGQTLLALFDELLANTTVRDRLGDLVPAAARLVADHREVVAAPRPTVLVHSDFNAKNILMRRGAPGVAAVLDWEFAFSGPALIDVGNFLRFDRDFPPGLEDGFVSGYRDAGGTLPAGYKQAAKLLDLTALLQFLSRASAPPRTVATARAAIADTLARWPGL